VEPFSNFLPAQSRKCCQLSSTDGAPWALKINELRMANNMIIIIIIITYQCSLANRKTAASENAGQHGTTDSTNDDRKLSQRAS